MSSHDVAREILDRLVTSVIDAAASHVVPPNLPAMSTGLRAYIASQEALGSHVADIAFRELGFVATGEPHVPRTHVVTVMCPACGGSGTGPDKIDGPGDVYQDRCETCDGTGHSPRMLEGTGTAQDVPGLTPDAVLELMPVDPVDSPLPGCDHRAGMYCSNCLPF